LMPGGQPIGIPGAGRQVWEVPGGSREAEELFANLSQGCTVNTPPGYPGKGCQLPGGGWVGLRPKSRSGVPTIDVNIPGMPIRKIKFV
jgi:hypothetical protein